MNRTNKAQYKIQTNDSTPTNTTAEEDLQLQTESTPLGDGTREGKKTTSSSPSKQRSFHLIIDFPPIYTLCMLTISTCPPSSPTSLTHSLLLAVKMHDIAIFDKVGLALLLAVFLQFVLVLRVLQQLFAADHLGVDE